MVDEVRRRDDGELCGHVVERDGQWCALVVFGSELGRHDELCIVEANAAQVTLALGYYSMPGVPTLTITARQLEAGDWELRR